MSTCFYDFHTHNPTPTPGIVKMLCVDPGVALNDVDGIFYSSGIHPWRAGENFDMSVLQKMLPHLSAIGEIGLDRLCGVPLHQQLETFSKHLIWQKPLIIHNVRCTSEILQRLPEPMLALWHRAPVKRSSLSRIIERGSMVSFSLEGLRFLNPALVPLSQLGLETDDSSVPIQEIYEAAAKLWQVSLEDLRCQLEQNFMRFYTLSG